MVGISHYFLSPLVEFVFAQCLDCAYFFFDNFLTKIDGCKVFLLTKIKPEYSDILYNPTHFPGPLVCQIRFHCTFVLPFNLTIALFVLLRTMASDSSFGILQLLILQAVKSSTVISIVSASQLLTRSN